MPFEKGREKTGGRKAGSMNRATVDNKSKIACLIDNHFESKQADLETLEPEDRIGAYLEFMEYTVSKQREQKLDLSTLIDEQVDDLLNKALSKSELTS